MASADSVTVSIAALRTGMFRRMLRVRRVETSTCDGTTVECCGTSSTSSKVSAVVMPSPVSVNNGEAVVKSMDTSYAQKADACRPFRLSSHAAAPWHFLYFFPLPHGQGSFRPTLGSSRRTVLTTSSPPVRAGAGACATAADDDRDAPANAGTDSAPGLLSVICVARRGADRGAAARAATASSSPGAAIGRRSEEH